MVKYCYNNKMKITEEIKIPTHCPECNSELEEINFQLFCRNTECVAVSLKTVENFFKKMKILGFGPKTVEKLDVRTVPAIFDLSMDDIKAVVGDKVGSKLYENIERAKICNFADYLASLSIPLIGSTASKKIASVANKLSEITEANLSKAGIGAKAQHNLLTWLESNAELYDSLVTFTESKPTQIVEKVAKVVITGKLNDFKNRTEAKDYLEQHGYEVVGSISSRTDYLVCEDGSTSSKTTKAKTLNIPIVTIEQLMENLNGLDR
jgi:NAD-dependent DNA ligase